MHAYRTTLTESSRTIEQRHTLLLRRFDQLVTTARNNLTRASQRIERTYRTIEKSITEANRAFTTIVAILRSEMKVIQSTLTKVEQTMPRTYTAVMRKSEEVLVNATKHLVTKQGRALRHAEERLTTLEQSIKTHDPARNLKLGYSLSYVNGTLIRSVKDLVVGTEADIRLHDGSFTSEIKQVL
jgi:exonuclease VII large subunit